VKAHFCLRKRSNIFVNHVFGRFLSPMLMSVYLWWCFYFSKLLLFAASKSLFMFHVCVAHSFSFLNEVMISFKISLTYTSLQKSSLKMDTVFKNMNKLAIVDDENSSCSVEQYQCQTDLSLLKNKIYFKINLIMPHHKGSSDSVQRDEYYNCAKESTSPMSQSSQESFKVKSTEIF